MRQSPGECGAPWRKARQLRQRHRGIIMGAHLMVDPATEGGREGRCGLGSEVGRRNAVAELARAGMALELSI